MDVIIVSQFLENQGKTTTINAVKKIMISTKPYLKLYLRLNNFNTKHKNERKNITIPVGLVKKIKPNAAPDNKE